MGWCSVAINLTNSKGFGRCSLEGLKSKNGFTLIELLIAIAVFSVIVGIIVTAKNEQTGSFMSQNQVVEMQQSLRVSMIIMTREIRKIGFDPHLDTAGVGFINCGVGTDADRLTFAFVADEDGVDNDGDGMEDEKREMQTVSIYLDNNNQLILNTTNAQTIAENVRGLTFTYLDNNGMAVAAPLTDARCVRISLTLSPDARYLYESGNNRTLTTMVKCRNITSV
jgi:type IV pilus assembly protein PilW